MYLSVTYGVARRTVAELVLLSNGDIRVTTHGLLWGHKTFEVAASSIAMHPLGTDSIGAKKLTFRIPSDRGSPAALAKGGTGKGQTLILDVRHGKLFSAAALRRIFGWDGNITAAGGGTDPVVIDRFTETVFRVPPSESTVNTAPPTASTPSTDKSKEPRSYQAELVRRRR